MRPYSMMQCVFQCYLPRSSISTWPEHCSLLHGSKPSLIHLLCVPFLKSTVACSSAVHPGRHRGAHGGGAARAAAGAYTGGLRGRAHGAERAAAGAARTAVPGGWDRRGEARHHGGVRPVVSALPLFQVSSAVVEAACKTKQDL